MRVKLFIAVLLFFSINCFAQKVTDTVSVRVQPKSSLIGQKETVIRINCGAPKFDSTLEICYLISGGNLKKEILTKNSPLVNPDYIKKINVFQANNKKAKKLNCKDGIIEINYSNKISIKPITVILKENHNTSSINSIIYIDKKKIKDIYDLYGESIEVKRIEVNSQSEKDINEIYIYSY